MANKISNCLGKVKPEKLKNTTREVTPRSLQTSSRLQTSVKWSPTLENLWVHMLGPLNMPIQTELLLKTDLQHTMAHIDS